LEKGTVVDAQELSFQQKGVVLWRAPGEAINLTASKELSRVKV
jgi:hypothetical protein